MLVYKIKCLTLQYKIKDIAMVTIKFINAKGQGQMTITASHKENVIASLLAVGYVILQIN